MDAFERLHVAAERRGLRVHLGLTGTGTRARLSRIAVLDRDLVELGAVRIGPRGLDRAAASLLEYLNRKGANR